MPIRLRFDGGADRSASCRRSAPSTCSGSWPGTYRGTRPDGPRSAPVRAPPAGHNRCVVELEIPGSEAMFPFVFASQELSLVEQPVAPLATGSRTGGQNPVRQTDSVPSNADPGFSPPRTAASAHLARRPNLLARSKHHAQRPPCRNRRKGSPAPSVPQFDDRPHRRAAVSGHRIVITAIRRARPSASSHTSAGIWLSLRYGPAGTVTPAGSAASALARSIVTR